MAKHGVIPNTEMDSIKIVVSVRPEFAFISPAKLSTVEFQKRVEKIMFINKH